MGVCDMLPKGSQVKLWECEMLGKEIGSKVPSFDLPSYIVILREGGFVKVNKGKIVKIQEEHHKPYYPEDFAPIPCFDKWGGQINNRSELEPTDPFCYYYWLYWDRQEEK